MVSIDRSIIRRIKNGHDLVTYHGVLVPPYSQRPYSSVVLERSLSALNNFVASVMLFKGSVDMEN